MKAVIFAGGLGTRITEETAQKPKPMIEIGGRPILWHIMKILSTQRINEFIVCCGYKGYMIKEYFLNYAEHSSDITVDLLNNQTIIHKKKVEPWKITLIDTGELTLTGLRLKKVIKHLENERFLLTYGDGVADIQINRLIDHHVKSKKLATVTAVQPPGRFGTLKIDKSTNAVTNFVEKPDGDGGWINGGFFILEPGALEYVTENNVSWESQPLNDLSKNNDLNAYFHRGFWHPMDTMRDKNHLEYLWQNDEAPWKIWQDWE